MAPNSLLAAETADDRLLRAALVNAADAVMITGVATGASGPRILYVNPAFSRMTGYAAHEVLNRSPRFLQGPESCPVSRAVMQGAIVAERPVTAELVNYRKDGSAYVVEISLSPVIDEHGDCRHWMAVQRDVTERRRAEEERTRDRVAEEKRLALLAERRERERIEARLEYTAAHDDLTGLYTRARFMQCVDAALARTQNESGTAFAIVYVDLDRFKLANDQLGHRTGDLILRDLARRFERLIGSGDTLARIGGDEFALLVEGADGACDAESVAGRFLAEVAQRSRYCGEGVTLSASVGIVNSTAAIDDAEVLMRDAEVAAGHAHRDGGNSFVILTPEMHAEAEASMRVRAVLQGAIERGELRLYFQPLVDIAMGRIYGFEGLVRWQHPERGLLLPDDFIPAAEADGLIVDIGRWVLAEGCRKARELQLLAGRPLLMSLNVSSSQLLDPRFLGHLKDVLATSGLDPATLQLEITESAFLAGGTAIEALFTRIRALGIKIAFDDFGTGYSSLAYLERFQIDTLKIDKSFVDRLHDASAKSEILRMIVALAHGLGVDLVAEGVETRAQRDALGILGCTQLQGFLFSRPLAEAQAVRLLDTTSAGRLQLDGMLRETLGGTAAASLTDAERKELRAQVDAAITTHHAWMETLRRAADGQNVEHDLAEVGREEICPIGIWLNTTISSSLRGMPLYHVTKSRHAVFHRSMARLLAAAAARRPEAEISLQPDGDVTMIAASLLRTLRDWRAFADDACAPL